MPWDSTDVWRDEDEDQSFRDHWKQKHQAALESAHARIAGFDAIAEQRDRREGKQADIAPSPEPLRDLTSREIEVLSLIADGHTNNAIAAHLFISEETVKTHARRILSALAASNRSNAVAIGFRNQLLT